MPLYEPLIPARYLAPLWGALQALPRSLLQPALEAAGLDQASLQQVQRVIPLALFDQLLDLTPGKLDGKFLRKEIIQTLICLFSFNDNYFFFHI